MPGFIYILKDQNNRFYIGSTDNIKRRLKQHKTGHTQTTRRMDNIKLVFSQEYDSLEQARAIEYRLKTLKRKDYIQKIINDGFIRMKL